MGFGKFEVPSCASSITSTEKVIITMWLREKEYINVYQNRTRCLPVRGLPSCGGRILPATRQVDSFAFDALEECIAMGSYDLCEEVPSGDVDGYLVQPLGGIAVDMAGPARYSSEDAC